MLLFMASSGYNISQRLRPCSRVPCDPRRKYIQHDDSSRLSRAAALGPPLFRHEDGTLQKTKPPQHPRTVAARQRWAQMRADALAAVLCQVRDARAAEGATAGVMARELHHRQPRAGP